jgi:Fatty acid hydroxylase
LAECGGFSGRPRPRDLSAARALSCRPRALAAASDASLRSRIRRQHGVALSPIEILLSMLIKLAVIAAIGAPPLAVLIFEVLLNATSIFNHANIRVPGKVDRILRWFVVTHRVHHSILVRETNSNFEFNLPWWDGLFGTYRAQPTAGHETMTIGVKQFRDPRDLRMDRMLLQPFLGDVGRYPIGQRDADQ